MVATAIPPSTAAGMAKVTCMVGRVPPREKSPSQEAWVGLSIGSHAQFSIRFAPALSTAQHIHTVRAGAGGSGLREREEWFNMM